MLLLPFINIKKAKHHISIVHFGFVFIIKQKTLKQHYTLKINGYIQYYYFRSECI